MNKPKWEYVTSPRKRAKTYVKTYKRLQDVYNHMVKTQALYCRTRKSCDECPFNIETSLYCKMENIHRDIHKLIGDFNKEY